MMGFLSFSCIKLPRKMHTRLCEEDIISISVASSNFFFNLIEMQNRFLFQDFQNTLI